MNRSDIVFRRHLNNALPIISKYVRIYTFSAFRLAIWIHRAASAYACIVRCILPADYARTVGRPYFKTYHLTWTSRTTTGACITGKCVPSFHVHDDPVKYFTRDPESVVAVEVNSKSSEKFTVACNHFYTLRHAIPSILSFHRELFWPFGIDENIRFAIIIWWTICAQ